MKTFALILLAAAAAGCAPSATTGSGSAKPDATATLKDSFGNVLGTAQLTQAVGGVHLVVDVNGVAPGKHGIHFHETGTCTPPSFTSAGGHFNPDSKHHGLENTAGPHAGDLPNLEVGGDGVGHLDVTTDRISLNGATGNLFDADGTALVLHAGPDDQKSDPSGNSGARIACGAVTRAGT
jgi:Cu-Zn family superoxide dismutase